METKTNTKQRRLRALIVVGVLIALALIASVLVSSVDIAALLKQMHGG